MPALEKNHIYRSTIEGYSSEGLGVARIDGQVVFVHDAVRGEDCDILVMKVLKNVAFGKPVLRYSTSPHRQEPPEEPLRNISSAEYPARSEPH